MSYPGLSLDAARSIDESRRGNLAGFSPPDIEGMTTWKTGPNFTESIAKDCLNQICDIVADSMEYVKTHGEFDSMCARLVHETLNISSRIAGDADFWRWLTFTEKCCGAEIVDWRYGNGRKKANSNQPARSVYYGLGLMKKGMFAKLWICANMMHVEDAPNPYDGIEVTDIDLWDSHVIDIDYGSVPAMARAFVKLVRNEKVPRGNPNAPDAPAGYRDLAKEIRRRHATVAFETFNESEAYEYIMNVWNERESWGER